MGQRGVGPAAGGLVVSAAAVLTSCSLLVSTEGLADSPGDASATGDAAVETGGNTGDGGEGGARDAATDSGLPSGLLAHFPFDGDARDATGNGNDGSASGLVRFDAPGVSGTAASCDGNGAGIDLGDRLDMGSRSFSVLAWVSFTGASKAMHTIFAKAIDWTNGNDTSAGYGLGYRADIQELDSSVADGARHDGSGTKIDLGDGTFHQLAMVLDRAASLPGGGVATELRVYVDGVQRQRTTVTVGSLGTSAPLLVCRYADNAEHDMRGLVDELMFYDRALSVGELAAVSRHFGR